MKPKTPYLRERRPIVGDRAHIFVAIRYRFNPDIWNHFLLFFFPLIHSALIANFGSVRCFLPRLRSSWRSQTSIFSKKKIWPYSWKYGLACAWKNCTASLIFSSNYRSFFSSTYFRIGLRDRIGWLYCIDSILADVVENIFLKEFRALCGSFRCYMCRSLYGFCYSMLEYMPIFLPQNQIPVQASNIKLRKYSLYGLINSPRSQKP